MFNKKLLFIPLVLVFCLLGTFDAEAQKKKRRPTAEETSRNETKVRSGFADKLTGDILVGQLGFGNTINLGFKPAVGYKITDAFSAGLAVKFRYIFLNQPAGQEDISIFEYGAGPYARLKFAQQFYIQGEYFYDNLWNGENAAGEVIRFTTFSPKVGAGYFSGFGDWAFGIQLMFVLNDTLRNATNEVVEYHFGASYKF